MSQTEMRPDSPDQAPMRLHVPEPAARPGEDPDFSFLLIPPVDEAQRPPIDASAHETYDLATTMIRVLDDSGRPGGAWQPELSAEQLRSGLSDMMTTRLLEEQFLLLQRQGKSAFAIRSMGEEAVAVSAAMAVDASSPGYGPGLDMHFPTYRQAGLLVANGHSITEMTCQILSNEGDRLKGAQLPSMHSVPECGFFSISGNLATQLIQGVGWAMAGAIQKKRIVGVAWTGEGATAENDFHSALVFASVYQPPAIINVVNNQWAISSFQGIAGGTNASFAQRGNGYGIATLRVDGNDFLAGYAASQWATERARAGFGPTLIEWVTYRAASHSSSDDPSKYRPIEAAKAWPLGDPIDRLIQHLIAIDEMSLSDVEAMRTASRERVSAAVAEAEALGTLNDGPAISPVEMFRHVYAEMPPHLIEQRQELGY
ncbi:MAG: thiamine pyrophosphate-dependent enzyme [Acidimicrobiales bacterium]